MSYEENRVRFATYGTAITGDEKMPCLGPVPKHARLAAVASAPGGKLQYLHWKAADAFDELVDAAKSEAGLDLRLASGWREPRFETEAQYNAFVKKRYGSVAAGRKKLAFNSAHHVGLAADFGTEGLRPVSATTDAQRLTPAHKWLVDNAYRFGFTPYKDEPWHWEYNISKDEWLKTPSDELGWARPVGVVGAIAAVAGGIYWFLKGRK